MYRKSKKQDFKSVSMLRIQAFVNIAHSYCLGPLRQDMALNVVLGHLREDMAICGVLDF